MQKNGSRLHGKVWIADFIFTSCVTVCPPMTANMTKLQKRLKEEGIEVELVSFSVDPATDTPEMLKNYISKFGADTSNWTLLTGYTQEYIEDYALKNFHWPIHFVLFFYDNNKGINQDVVGVDFVSIGKLSRYFVVSNYGNKGEHRQRFKLHGLFLW